MAAKLAWAILWLMEAAAIAQGQKFEITALIGGQLNGGLDLSTASLRHIDAKNGLIRGLALSYEPKAHAAVEFMWTYSNPDTFSQPIGGGPSTKIFVLDENRYFGNLLFHLANGEKPLRPFLLGGIGITDLAPAYPGVSGATRLAFALGGGVKYNFSRWFGLRLQVKWSPTYLSTTNGYWCDAVWGGCWSVGQNHYLNELDGTAALTFRF